MDSVTLDRVEARRLELEDNIAKFRKSLRYWQNLELDYEGLREEIQLLPADASKDVCLSTARDFKPVAVGEKDIVDLISDKNSSTGRSPQEVVDLLSKRIDYVTRNADTIRGQIESEVKKLNAIILAENPETRDAAELPLSEITEELDEDGNVISSKVDRPGSGAAGLAEVLEKAGVEGIAQNNDDLDAKDEPPSAKATVASSSMASLETPKLPDFESSDEEDDLGGLDRYFKANLPVRPPAGGENPIPVQVRDTEEEARMCREMLEYGLDEVGAIVAELDMQEGESDVSYDEDDDNLIIDSDFDDEDDEDESEDEFGRVKNPVISEKYKQKMQELEKKLGLTDLKNLGPNPSLPSDVQDALDRPSAAEAARKAAIARDDANVRNDTNTRNITSKKKSGKKSVAFADNLDIAKEVPAKRKADSPAELTTAINPIGETVLERDPDATSSSPPAPPAPTQKKSASRFKASRTTPTSNLTTPSSSQPQPSPPPDHNGPRDPNRPLLAPQVLERPTSSTSAPAPDPDAIDDEMHRRQIAMEYHKMRNQKIHEQGGFVRDEDQDEEWEDEMMGRNVVVDEETGEVKRVSRFKAARLKG